MRDSEVGPQSGGEAPPVGADGTGRGHETRPDPVLALMKFGCAEHIHELVADGHLYMSTLGYFADLEGPGPRSDRSEGADYSVRAKGGRLRRRRGHRWLDVGTLAGPVLCRYDASIARASNIYCLYALRGSQAETLVDPRNHEFGDTFALFTLGDEFVRRVRGAAERDGLNLAVHSVAYEDPETYIGEMGPFRKFSGFSYQSEVRFVVKPGLGRARSLRVGSLSDIAIVGQVEELNRRLQVETHGGEYITRFWHAAGGPLRVSHEPM